MNDVRSTYCFYCERPFGRVGGVVRLRTKDHIIPRSKRGRDLPINYLSACKRCNGLKSDMTPEQFAAHLRFLLSGSPKNISKKTIQLILKNTEELILKIAPYRHEMVYGEPKSKKEDSPTKTTTPLWWRGLNEK